jgi:hypothetical protein
MNFEHNVFVDFPEVHPISPKFDQNVLILIATLELLEKSEKFKLFISKYQF